MFNINPNFPPQQYYHPTQPLHGAQGHVPQSNSISKFSNNPFIQPEPFEIAEDHSSSYQEHFLVQYPKFPQSNITFPLFPPRSNAIHKPRTSASSSLRPDAPVFVSPNHPPPPPDADVGISPNTFRMDHVTHQFADAQFRNSNTGYAANSAYFSPQQLHQQSQDFETWGAGVRRPMRWGSPSTQNLSRQAVGPPKRGRRGGSTGRAGGRANHSQLGINVQNGSMRNDITMIKPIDILSKVKPNNITTIGSGICQSTSLGEIVKKATEKNLVANPTFWKKYPDILTMAAQTNKDAIVEILENFAGTHKKQVFLLQRLKATILNTLKDYTASDLATICHSFVVLGFLHEDFVLAISNRIVSTASMCTAAELTRLLDAYASLRYNAPDPIRVITAETFKKLSDFGISDLMTHASSFTRLNLHNHKLFTMIAERILVIEAEMEQLRQQYDQKVVLHTKLACSESLTSYKIQDNCSDQSFLQLTSTSTAVPSTDSPTSSIGEINLGHPHSESDSAITECASSANTAMVTPKFSARDLTLAAYSFAKLGFHFPAVFQFVSRHAKVVIRDFTAHQIQMVAVAFQRSGIRDVELFHEMSVQAQRRMAQFNAESVALLLRSYSLFDIRDEGLFTRVVAQLPRLILTFRPLDVVTTLNAFAQLNVSSPALMAIVIPHILEDCQKFTASDLQSILHACAKLGSVHSDFLALFSTQCNLFQLSVGQLTLVATDLPKLAYRNLQFILKLHDAIRLKTEFLSITMMAQILASFLFLDIHGNPQFLPLMQYLSTQIRIAWESCRLEPFGRGITSLCIAEMTLLSSFVHPSSLNSPSNSSDDPLLSIPEVIRSLIPIHPTEFLYRLLATQPILPMTSNSTTGVQSSDSPTNIPLAAASDNGGANRTNHCSDTPDQIFSKNAAVIEVVEHINLIRAAMYSLPGFPKEIREATRFAIGRRASAGCLYGTAAGSIERETEFALQEIASVLKNACGLDQISIHLPSEIDYDEIPLHTTAPHLCSSIVTRQRNSSTMHHQIEVQQNKIQNESIPGTLSNVHRNGNDMTTESESLMRQIATESPISTTGDRVKLNVQHTEPRTSFLSPTIANSDKVGSILVSAMNSKIEDQTNLKIGKSVANQFQLIPYHSFLTIPQNHLNSLRRWIPETSETPNRLSSEMSGEKRHDNSNNRLFGRIINATDDQTEFNNCSSDCYSCSSASPGLQRTRSQSDSLLYGRLDFVSDDGPFSPPMSKLLHSDRNETKLTETNQANRKPSGSINTEDPAGGSGISLMSNPRVPPRQHRTERLEIPIREIRSNSEILTRNPIDQSLTSEHNGVGPRALVIWGGFLYFWHQIDPLQTIGLETNKKQREDELEWTTDLFDDEDEDDEDFTDDQITMDVKKALEAHRNYVNMLTPIARLQLRIFAALVPDETQIFLIPDIVWRSIKLVESRRAFLASLLLDVSHSVKCIGFNRHLPLTESVILPAIPTPPISPPISVPDFRQQIPHPYSVVPPPQQL